MKQQHVFYLVKLWQTEFPGRCIDVPPNVLQRWIEGSVQHVWLHFSKQILLFNLQHNRTHNAQCSGRSKKIIFRCQNHTRKASVTSSLSIKGHPTDHTLSRFLLLQFHVKYAIVGLTIVRLTWRLLDLPLHISHETAVARTYSVCGLLNVPWKAPFRVEHYFLDDRYETDSLSINQYTYQITTLVTALSLIST